MRNVPGFLPYLQSQLHSLERSHLDRINNPSGLDLSNLINQVVNPKDHTVYDAEEVDATTIKSHSDIHDDFLKIGEAAISNGEVAFCILTNDDKGVGALSKIPVVDVSLLTTKLLQSQAYKHVWIMTNSSNHEEIKSHVNEVSGRADVLFFRQFDSVRLTPDNQLHLQDGEPSFYSCGSGDLIPALQKNGILADFLKSGGKHIFVVDVRNISADMDVAVVGQHVASKAVVTCEVVERLPEDAEGLLCNHMGFDQVIDQFRFSARTDSIDFKWVGTGSCVFRADLDFSDVQWSWHRLKKIHNGKLVVQHERFFNEMTSVFQTQYVGVPREERFMFVKNTTDLQNASRIFRKI